MPSERLLPARDEPDREERAVPGRVGLLDAHVGDAGLREAARERLHLDGAGHRQDDGVGAGGQVAGAALAGGVHHLGGLEAARQVGAHHDVVAEILG